MMRRCSRGRGIGVRMNWIVLLPAVVIHAVLTASQYHQMDLRCSDLTVTVTKTITKSNSDSFTQTITKTESKINTETILKLTQITE